MILEWDVYIKKLLNRLMLLLLLITCYFYISRGYIELRFVNVTPVNVKILNGKNERLNVRPKNDDLVKIKAKEHGYFDIFIQYEGNRVIHLFLCHQNNWLKDEITISFDKESTSRVSVKLRNQESETFEQFKIYNDSVVKKRLGICG